MFVPVDMSGSMWLHITTLLHAVYVQCSALDFFIDVHSKSMSVKSVKIIWIS